MCEVVFIIKKDVIDDLHTVCHALDSYIASETEGISSSSKTHGASVILEAKHLCDL